MKFEEIRFDCRYFKGYIPCLPNKLRNKVCTCDEFMPISKKILIIKLGAMGDVIRTTPLLTKFREIYQNCHITWLTLTPEILPREAIDEIYRFDFTAWQIAVNQKFDIAVNLDKDREACLLLNRIDAPVKYGFVWNEIEDHLDAATPEAMHKILTGIFDNLSKQNTKNYIEEIFEICGFKFNKEPHLLNIEKRFVEKWSVLREYANGKKIVGLNTGCGKRWLTRLWPEEYWIELINRLKGAGVYPVLLGGPEEDLTNKTYAEKTGVNYPGTYSLGEFIGITSNTDIIVTAVSMMMHIAIGLKKNLVLFNNIFNKQEFELYGRGVILEPTTGCDDYYGNTCTRERHCMKDILPEKVFSAVMDYAKN